MNTGRPIAFLVKTYPKVSETFILGEILGLEKRGLNLHIFSLYPPTDPVSHSAARNVRAPVRYVSTRNLIQVLRGIRAHLSLAVRRPYRYAGTFGFLARRAEGNRFRDFFRAGRLAGMLREAGITHIHAHFASEPADVAELARRLAGISYSISAHAKDIYLSSPESLRRKIQNARFTTTCTEYNRRYLESVAGSDANIHRVYHGVDMDLFCPDSMPALSADREAPPLILSVGRLREKKGFPVLLESCRDLRDAGVSIRCQIIGYGPERGNLERLIERWKLEEVVELVGILTHDDLIERYREAALFVLPCRIAKDGDRDGIPNVLLEAMAMRLPVVSTRVSGIPEVIEDGKNGLLVDQNSPGQLADAIGALLESSGLRARLGASGRETVSGMFSVDRNIRLICDLLLDEASRPTVGVQAVPAEDEIYAR